jgi:hypothetical protein
VEKLEINAALCQGTTSVVPQLPQDKAAGLAPATISPSLWLDADLRWLTGVHEAEGHDYLVRESYEELLWWLQLPLLLRLAGEAAPSRAVLQAINKGIEEALTAAEAAGYRVDLLLAPVAAESAGEEVAAETEPAVEAVVPVEPPEPLPNSDSLPR